MERRPSTVISNVSKPQEKNSWLAVLVVSMLILTAILIERAYSVTVSQTVIHQGADPSLVNQWLAQQVASPSATVTSTATSTPTQRPHTHTPTVDVIYTLPHCDVAQEGEACAPILQLTPSIYKTPTPYPICQEEDYDVSTSLMKPCTKPTSTSTPTNFSVGGSNDSIGVVSTNTPTPYPTSTLAPTYTAEELEAQTNCYKMNHAPC
jgi:hypothetical protein